MVSLQLHFSCHNPSKPTNHNIAVTMGNGFTSVFALSYIRSVKCPSPPVKLADEDYSEVDDEPQV